MSHPRAAAALAGTIAAGLAAALAFAAGRLIGSPGWAAAALLIIGLGLLWQLVVMLRKARGERADLHRVEGIARALLERDWSTGEEPSPGEGAQSGPYGTLHVLLAELGGRLRSQLREVGEKTRKLESLIEALDEPVLATDNQDRILLANRAAEEMLDATRGGLLGRPLHEVLTHEALREQYGRARRGQTARARVQLTTPLGPRTFQISAWPVFGGRGEGVVGVVLLLRDITELDRAVQVKTDFVANASHELRTPVAAIKGAAETLAVLGPEERAQAERLVAMIDAHATRLEEMLRDLMDLSRLEAQGASLAASPLSRSDLTESLRSAFEEECRRRNVMLVFDLSPELEGFPTDRRLLLLVLRNLVENAARFAREGTPVHIAGTLLTPEAGGADGDEAIARFEVIDRGPGIPLEHQDRVFERYYQVEPARTGGAGGARRGTGLGLAIVKHAARVLGGAVGLESVYGQGTMVWMEIPAVRPPERVVMGPGDTAPPPAA